ncbi:hypothetical protein ACQK5W_09990 [Pantoea sp. FN060301]|uniref:hypothetical protein n=1 Tax=Pantoea sp. FN060301 TaxID=3420380 RepID=UPI003D185DC9
MPVLFLITGNAYFAGTALIITCLAPFYFVLAWFSVSSWGKYLRASSARFWMVGVLFSVFLFLFFILSRQWANGAINQVFSVDPSLLPLTAQLITPLYIPFNFIFNDIVSNGILIVSVLLALTISPVLFFWLIVNGGEKWQKTLLRVALLVLVNGLISYSAQIFQRVGTIKNDLIVNVALWADFNDRDYCRNAWAAQSHKTLFLSAEKVMVFFPDNPPPLRLQIKECTP